VDALRDPVSFGVGFAELETPVAIDRHVLALHHGHEDVRAREELVDGGRGIGIGRSRIVVRKSLLLRADHALCGGDIVARRCGDGEREQGKQKQGDSAHGAADCRCRLA
jgi:hypothetical protein